MCRRIQLWSRPHWFSASLGEWDGGNSLTNRWAVIPGRMEEEAPGEGQSWVRGALRRKT